MAERQLPKEQETITGQPKVIMTRVEERALYHNITKEVHTIIDMIPKINDDKDKNLNEKKAELRALIGKYYGKMDELRQFLEHSNVIRNHDIVIDVFRRKFLVTVSDWLAANDPAYSVPYKKLRDPNLSPFERKVAAEELANIGRTYGIKDYQ